jgi:hypothetical protein
VWRHWSTLFAIDLDCLFDNPAELVENFFFIVAVTPAEDQPGALPT